MPASFLIKPKFIFFFCLTVLFGFCFALQVRAELAPEIYVTELKINESKAGEIKGEFTVWNNEQYFLSDLNYTIKLFQGVSFEELKLIDAVVLPGTFFAPPGEKVIGSFNYIHPKNIVSGDYTLRVQVTTERGGELGWRDEKLFLEGSNNFLDILHEFSQVLVGEEKDYPLVGINVYPQDQVVGYLKAKNPGETITVVPHIKIFKRQFNMPLLKEYEDSPITFSKNETKEIRLTMPKLDVPESYLAEIKFYKNNEQVSGIQYFRWVVKGEGGKILYVKADKDYYKAGENIEITIELIGPADLVDIGQGKLEVIVYDKDKNLVGQTIKDITLNSDLFSSVITIPVKKDLISPEIKAKLIKNENILDERYIELPLFSQGAKDLDKGLLEKGKIEKYLIYLALPLTILAILIIVFLVFKLRAKKNEKSIA